MKQVNKNELIRQLELLENKRARLVSIIDEHMWDLKENIANVHTRKKTKMIIRAKQFNLNAILKHMNALESKINVLEKAKILAPF